MEYVNLTLPVYASANFRIKKPDNWEELSNSEKYDLFIDKMGSNSSLCHQCCHDIETNFEVDTDFLDTYTVEEFMDEHYVADFLGAQQ
jgi:hypothetical protein